MSDIICLFLLIVNITFKMHKEEGFFHIIKRIRNTKRVEERTYA